MLLRIVETYLKLFEEVAEDVSGIRYLKEKLGDYLSDESCRWHGNDYIQCRGCERMQSSDSNLIRHWCGGSLIIPEPYLK